MSGGRLCPRCSTLIESPSAVFCFNCGQELGRVAEPTSAVETVAEVWPAVLIQKRKVTLKLVLFSLALVLFLILTVSLYFLKAGVLNRTGNLKSSTANELIATVSALPLAPFNFGKNNYAALAPAETSLYLEGGNLKSFLVHFLAPNDQTLLAAKTGLNLEEVTSFFEPDFAFIRSASASALLVVSRDPEFVKSRLAKLSSDTQPGFLKGDLLGNYLVVTSSNNLLKDITQTYQKTHLSLLATAAYLESLKRLSPSGQILIYGTDSPNVLYGLRIFFAKSLDRLFEELRGTVLVVGSREGNAVLEGRHE